MRSEMCLAVLGSPEMLALCAPVGLEPLLVALGAPEGPEQLAQRLAEAQCEVAVVLSGHAQAFEACAAMGLPTIAWCAGPERPPLQAQDRWVSPIGSQGAWRHLPMPVADALYAPPWDDAGRPYWLGEASERRAEYVARFRDRAEPDGDVAINLLDAPAAEFEHRAAVALAGGRLLVSETLPSRGLEPGLDYLEAHELDELFMAVETVSRRPRAFRRMRLRGYAKAAGWRASDLIGRAAHDLLVELGRR